MRFLGLGLLFVIASILQISSCANILFYWGVSTYSHRIIVWPLVEKLVERGHNVTFLSPYQSMKPNPKVHEIYREELAKALERKPIPGLPDNATLVHLRLKNIHGVVWDNLLDTGVRFCKAMTETPELVNWVNTSQYDLVIIDALYNECALGLAYKFKASHISFGTTTVFMWMYDIFGFPAETSWIPDLAVGFPRDMTFGQKVSNTLRPLYWYFVRHWLVFPKLESMLRETFDMPHMPPLHQLEREASLVLLNSHYSLDYARSLPPLIVPVGGMQCTNSTKPLPQNIEAFIEAGGDAGFIYVSFGSHVQFSKIPENIKRIFFEAFGNSSSIRFVWKWESEVPIEMPQNVITSKWMPQQDILSHPKIRGFISHSGLLSTQEATYHGVPMIAFPIFAEQDFNAERINNQGIGIRLEMTELTLPKLHSAIRTLLTDYRYKERMMETSRIFKERPMNPLDTAVWWTEFILRNKKVPSYLLPLGAHQTWYERRGLDVWAFLLLTILLNFIIVSYVSCVLLKYFKKYLTKGPALVLKDKDI